MTQHPIDIQDKLRKDCNFRHDINNFLMAIYYYADSLTRDCDQDSTNHKTAMKIRESTRQVLAMIGENLTGEVGHGPVSYTPASILLVDDQPDIRTILVMMLEGRGYEVFSCETGTSALDLLAEKPDYFDLVITDYTMPDMTGTELAKRMEAVADNMPVIIVSGQKKDTLNALQKISSRIKAVVQKPVIPEDLFNCIEQTLNIASEAS